MQCSSTPDARDVKDTQKMRKASDRNIERSREGAGDAGNTVDEASVASTGAKRFAIYEERKGGAERRERKVLELQAARVLEIKRLGAPASAREKFDSYDVCIGRGGIRALRGCG